MDRMTAATTSAGTTVVAVVGPQHGSLQVGSAAAAAAAAAAATGLPTSPARPLMAGGGPTTSSNGGVGASVHRAATGAGGVTRYPAILQGGRNGQSTAAAATGGGGPPPATVIMQQPPPPGSYGPSDTGGATTTTTTTTRSPPPPPQPGLPLTTPWTLGSTDASYAINLILLQEKALSMASMADQGGGSGGDATTTGATGAPASDDKGTTSEPTPQQQQQPTNNNHHNNTNNLIYAGGGRGGGGGGGGTGNNNRLSPEMALLRDKLLVLHANRSLYQDRLFRQSSANVEAVLAAACEVIGFDIAEMWLRTGPKTHQLTNSHLRPTALEDSVRKDLVDVYYGDKSSERTHRLSPALCKRAKEANDVVWITAHTNQGAEALRCSISNVRTAVAIPICHEASNTNVTIIFFSIRKVVVRPTSVEFLVHMALAAGVSSINVSSSSSSLSSPPVDANGIFSGMSLQGTQTGSHTTSSSTPLDRQPVATSGRLGDDPLSGESRSEHARPQHPSIAIRHQRVERVSIAGAPLDLQWRRLQHVEYLTDGGNSWIHTGVLNGRPVVIKTLKPECQDVVLAINEIESELAVHSRLSHPNIVALIGAGMTSKSVRFVVLERLDGGTLTQMLGYDTRIRDRRRRFWKKKQFSFLDVLRIAKSIAEAMQYCHEEAIPGSVVLHRDIKPDNIGFSLDGTVKLLDFGLARIMENASATSNEVYRMSGETGSLRYMAPEVAEELPYNASADVYSFGIVLWEINAGKKPFEGLNRESFYERVVHGGERPPLRSKWPQQFSNLMSECWDADIRRRPTFRQIVQRLTTLINNEKGGGGVAKKTIAALPKKLSGMIDRHSTWF